MVKVSKQVSAQYGVLAVILLAAVVFHMPYALEDLPYVNHPDEPTNLHILHRMMIEGTANPKFFNYPSLLFYLNAPGQFLAGFLSDGPIYLQVQAMGTVYAPAPEAILLARLTSLLAHVAIVSVIYAFLLPRVGVVLAGAAAFLTAMSPITATYAIWATPDVFAALFVTLCLIACVRIVEQGRTKDFVIAGVMAGLAAATKYNAGFVAVGIIAAAALAPLAMSERAQMLARAALCSIIAMFVAAPFLFLDFGTALSGFLFELKHYSAGHWGAEGNAFGLNLQWVAAGLGAAALLMFPALRRREMLPVLIFVIGYFALLASQTVRFERNLALLVPAVAMLAAVSVADIVKRVSLAQTHRQPVSIAAAVLIAFPALWAWQQTPYPDSAYTTSGRDWVESIVPKDAQVVVEAYAPYLQGKDRQVQAVKFAMHDDWQQFSPSHLVLSARASQRFYEDPRTRSDYTAWIDGLTADACEVHTHRPDQVWRYKVFKFECSEPGDITF